MMHNPWNFFARHRRAHHHAHHHDHHHAHQHAPEHGRGPDGPVAHFGGRGRGGPWGFGGPPGVPGRPPGGPGDFGPPWSFFRRGPRARRGDVRAGILALLAEQPRNGYQIMQELEQRSGGVWHPSPGSIYPSLQQLEDEGLVRSSAIGNGRLFELTETGRAYVAEHKDEVAEPWAAFGDAGDATAAELMGLLHEVAAASAQVARAGNAAHVARAKKVLASARRELYRVLADEADET